MTTIHFIGLDGKGQVTVKNSLSESVVTNLLAVGYGILSIEKK